MACVNDDESTADFCRRMGWGPGVRLKGRAFDMFGGSFTLDTVGCCYALVRTDAGELMYMPESGVIDWSVAPTGSVGTTGAAGGGGS